MTIKYDLFANGGQMGELARAHPWERSALGSPANWSPLLQSTLRLVLTAQHPMLVWWGAQLIQFYNDACSHALGPHRHSTALGQPGPDYWPEIWHRLEPEIAHVLAGKGATWHVDEVLPFTHGGSLAEQRWTYGFSPLEDQDGVHGVLVLCNDVGAERRAYHALATANQRLQAEVTQRQDLERQQAFQLRLLDALVGLGSADDIAARAFAILGQELRASSVNYARIDADSGDFLITHAWHRAGLASVIGYHGNLRMFGTAMCSALERGETFSATDIRRDPRTADCAPAYQRLSARAVLIVPIIKNGKLCAGLGINSSTPREWPARHLTLLVDVAQRIWNAIERTELEALRLHSQQALLAHQARETENLRRLFQQAPGFIAVLKGPQHIFDIANDAYRAAVGGRELIGRRIREALPELDGQGFFELLDHVYASGTPYLARGMEVRLRQTNGEEPEQKFVDFVFQPILDAHQVISGIFVEGSDISDKYRAEQRQRYRTALSDQLRQRDAIEPLIDAAASLLGQHLEVARVVALEFARDSGEAMCRAVWQHGGAPGPTRAALLSSITPQLRASLTAIQTVTIDDVQHDMRLHEQRALYATLNIGACLMVPVAETGTLTLVLAVQQQAPQRWRADQIATVRDTAERTAVALSNLRARIELDRERHQSAYVFNTMTEGFAVVDRNWTILQMNSEGLRLTRREAASTIGHNHWAVFPELVSTDLQVAYQKVRETRAAQLIEIPYPDAAGAVSWIEIRIYPALDDGLAFFFRDVTARKQIEQKLVDADRRKDEFLAMLAHELRNPLAPIRSAADVLSLLDLPDQRVQRTSGIIKRQVSHMTRLIDDLLDVSRVTRGLIDLDCIALDMKLIIHDAVEQVRPAIERHRHHLEVRLPPESVLVNGDKIRLVQVVANVLGNAIKFTPDGGTLALSLAATAEQLVLTMADNGIGMSRELIGNMFDLFTQGTRAADRSQGGLGIGLALVRSLVALHGGAVAAFSDGPGQGSRIVVQLPRIAPLTDRNAVPASSDRLNARHEAPLEVLIVDDNVDAADMLGFALENAGHRIQIAYHATAALARASAQRFDVYLLDIGLPDIDGRELARRLRAHPHGSDATLIAVTGYGQPSDREEALRAGFDQLFVKPVDQTELTTYLARRAAPGNWRVRRARA